MSLRHVQWLFGSWGDKFVVVGMIRLESKRLLYGEADAESRDSHSTIQDLKDKKSRMAIG